MLKKADSEFSKIRNNSWKEKSKEYLIELQKFLDKADSIQDESLRMSIIYQMLSCDRVLTKLSEELFEKYYMEGLKNTMN